jgi:thioredoxin 1
MVNENDDLCSEENKLNRIREKKLAELKEKKQHAGNAPVHVTDSDFNEITGKHPLALIDFWASWCGPCQALAPTIEELANDYAGKVFIGKLDVDENPRTAECFQVFSIPTLLVMKNGREVDRIVGCVPKRHIDATLRRHME